MFSTHRKLEGCTVDSSDLEDLVTPIDLSGNGLTPIDLTGLAFSLRPV